MARKSRGASRDYDRNANCQAYAISTDEFSEDDSVTLLWALSWLPADDLPDLLFYIVVNNGPPQLLEDIGPAISGDPHSSDVSGFVSAGDSIYGYGVLHDLPAGCPDQAGAPTETIIW